MSLLKIIIIAIVQGLAELLPVSSSAHVVVAEKLLGLDPSSPPMTLLLVMLHTGTMFAVIVYFWPRWRSTYFSSAPAFRNFAALIVIATALTAVVGEAIKMVIEKTAFRNLPHDAAPAGRKTNRGFSQYEECQSEMNANGKNAHCKVASMLMGLSGH